MSHLGMTPSFGERRRRPVDDPAAETDHEAPWRAAFILAAAVMTAFLFSVSGLGEDNSPRAGDDRSTSTPHVISDVRYHAR